MPTFRLLAACFVTAALCTVDLAAHGGNYPPTPAPAPPPSRSAPAPAAAPQPGGPATGGPVPGPTTGSLPSTGGAPGPGGPGPGGGGGPTTGPRGLPIETDYGTWEFWWQFNRHRFLRLREVQAGTQTGSDDFYLGSTRREDARDALRPTEQQLIGVVLPALKRALDATDNRDITTACMVAMAKIGTDHPDFRLADVFAAHLDGGEQEVRETAALCLGIAGRASAEVLDLLEGLALDDKRGRTARGGAVEIRVRAFACYGLGVLARGSADNAVKARAFAALQPIVADRGLTDRNLKVAAISAIGLLAPDQRGYAGARLCEQACAVLEQYYRTDLGAGDEWIQAHCPTAIARLVGRQHARSGYYRQQFLQELQQGADRRGANAIAQSCALALGRIATPYENADSVDAACSQVLLEASRSHGDESVRNFSLMALAQIGGAENRAALLREFDKANKAIRRPWCALALGVLAWGEREQRRGEGPDATIASTLLGGLQQAKEPGLTGALAIGLGLCGATDAAPLMRERLRDGVAKEGMAGYLCVGLALMDDKASIETLQQVLDESERRPVLLVQAAVALGRLGDRRIAEDLVARMTAGEPSLSKLASFSSALGFIGDCRVIPPLVEMLQSSEIGMLPRAFAAAALGGIADRLPLPWNTPIGADINYRANVETLTNQSSGVLDIL